MSTRDDQNRRRSRWLLVGLTLALPSAALAQAGMGTGGSNSGNQAGGVSASETPRDPTEVGRVQATRQSPLAAGAGASELREARDVDAERARDTLRPDAGAHPLRIHRMWR